MSLTHRVVARAAAGEEAQRLLHVLQRGPDVVRVAFRLDDADWQQQMYDGFLMTFLEDVDILEAQQASMMRDPDRPLIDLNVDAPGLAARRMVADRIALEQGIAQDIQAVAAR